MAGTRVAAWAGRVPLRKLNRCARHRTLGQATVLRRLLDDVAIAITRGKIHPAVNAADVLTQDLLDRAHGLDKLAPVHRAEQAETRDAVADGNLVGGLALVLRLDQLLDRRAGFRKALLNPGERQGQGGALPLQPARQFRHERTHQGRIRPRHVRNHQNQALGILLGGRGHLVRPIVGVVAVDPVAGDARRNAAEILHQRQTEHDGQSPKFTQLQRGDRLVGRDETTEALRINAPIAVRDCLQGDGVGSRQTRGWAVQQARQFSAVPLRQMFPGGADLLLDQVEVVEQPFPSRRNPPVGRNRLGQQVADPKQNVFVLGQPGQELVRGALRGSTGASPPSSSRAAPSVRRLTTLSVAAARPWRTFAPSWRFGFAP